MIIMLFLVGLICWAQWLLELLETSQWHQQDFLVLKTFSLTQFRWNDELNITAC